jgi:hypothetical protein
MCDRVVGCDSIASDIIQELLDRTARGELQPLLHHQRYPLEKMQMALRQVEAARPAVVIVHPA